MAIKGKKGKLSSHKRSKLRIRKKVEGSAERPRLSVFRSGRHTYAQVISDESGITIAQASTMDKDVLEQAAALAKAEPAAKGEEKETAEKRPASSSTKSVAAAMAVGALVARRCREKNINTVVFDRNGFLYHGRIRAVAEGARKEGLSF